MIKKRTFLAVLISIILAALMFLIFQINNSSDNEEMHLCTPEQRQIQACIQLYKPVCGWNDPEKIQCIKYPCAQVYSNSCFACANENVLYWTEGECPK